MNTNFWFNLDLARKEVRKERKAIIEECDLPNSAFTKGIKLKSDPGVSTAYRCAKSVKKTVEELVDGENGLEYVKGIFKNDGSLFVPPERIVDIVKGLNILDDEDLNIVRGAVTAALLNKRGDSAEVAEK
jgi:hypothetical protein